WHAWGPSSTCTKSGSTVSRAGSPPARTRRATWSVNIRRDQWRKAAIRHRAASALREDLAVASDVESAVIARRLVWSALDQLEPRRRAIVVMHELEGMTAAAIAATLGLRRMTVHWHLSMGRKDLRRVLAPHMGETT